MSEPPAPAQRLAALLKELEEAQRGLRFREGEGYDAPLAGLALTRQVALHAQAVLTLVSAGEASAASANLRSQFEAWLDLRYMLLHGDPHRNAQKCFVFAHLELLAFLNEINEPVERRKAVERDIEALRERIPDVVAEVEAARRSGSLYWTGKSRRKLLSEIGKKWAGGEARLAAAYKLQSWDSHHVMTLIKDVRAGRIQDGVVEFGFGFGLPSTAGDEDFLLAEAYEMLNDAWRLIRPAFAGDPPGA